MKLKYADIINITQKTDRITNIQQEGNEKSLFFLKLMTHQQKHLNNIQFKIIYAF